MSEALSMEDSGVTFETMLNANCNFLCIASSAVGVPELQKRGFDSPGRFKLIGMRSIDLNDLPFTRELICAFGVRALRECFIELPHDIVSLAGGQALSLLKLGIHECLEMCLGEPEMAYEYLSAQPDLVCLLPKTSVDRLLGCGLRERALMRLGLGMRVLIEQMNATPAQLELLGFSRFRLAI